MRNFTYLLLLAAFLTSCSSTNLVFLSVKKPAPVSLPGYVKNVGLVNRTLVGRESKTLDDIHRVLSLESEELIRQGSRSSVSGLRDELMNNDRFTSVKLLDTLSLRSFGSGIFPAAMEWETVEKICRENQVDALFSLELFDAESRVNYSSKAVNLSTGLGNLPNKGNIPLLEHQINMATQVTTGWRIYDPSSHIILDEYSLSRDLNFYGSGINPVAAASALVGKKEAVKQAGSKAGQIYGTRIEPFWIRVTRDYFVRGNDQLALAKRKAQTGNWDEAGKIWEKETGSSNATVAGRACYNMAIINEINGDLDAAISWAQKAYENYRIRLALNYVNILRDRKAKETLLKIQNENGSSAKGF